MLMQMTASSDAIKDIRSAYMHLSHRMLIQLAVILMVTWRRSISNGLSMVGWTLVIHRDVHGHSTGCTIREFCASSGPEDRVFDIRLDEGAQVFHLKYDSHRQAQGAG